MEYEWDEFNTAECVEFYVISINRRLLKYKMDIFIILVFSIRTDRCCIAT